MKHDVFSVDQIKISCPETVLASNFLRHLPLLTEYVSGSQCAFIYPKNESVVGADIEISFSARKNRDAIVEKIGRISLRPYYPKQRSAGWIASARHKNALDLSELEERAFGTPANIVIPSMASRISAMKSTGMAAILPDVIGGLDKDLICSDNPDHVKSLDLWLNIDRATASKPSHAATVEWLKACAHSLNWLNAPMNWEPASQVKTQNTAFH